MMRAPRNENYKKLKDLLADNGHLWKNGDIGNIFRLPIPQKIPAMEHFSLDEIGPIPYEVAMYKVEIKTRYPDLMDFFVLSGQWPGDKDWQELDIWPYRAAKKKINSKPENRLSDS